MINKKFMITSNRDHSFDNLVVIFTIAEVLLPLVAGEEAVVGNGRNMRIFAFASPVLASDLCNQLLRADGERKGIARVSMRQPPGGLVHHTVQRG
ncbi:hypothetical protein VV869_10485 [Photobacterium sp. MCCC 1A19761]|uniref:hypothetical protein n=1 Tax=Photobacterium sp. MCCC 1A19761 TaxID=3115000 RepID=UPI00307DFD1D